MASDFSATYEMARRATLGLSWFVSTLSLLTSLVRGHKMVYQPTFFLFSAIPTRHCASYLYKPIYLFLPKTVCLCFYCSYQQPTLHSNYPFIWPQSAGTHSPSNHPFRYFFVLFVSLCVSHTAPTAGSMIFAYQGLVPH